MDWRGWLAAAAGVLCVVTGCVEPTRVLGERREVPELNVGRLRQPREEEPAVRLPVTTGEAFEVEGWKSVAPDGAEFAEVRIEGPEAEKRADWWVAEGRLFYRAKRPGAHKTLFIVRHGEEGAEFGFECMVRLARLRLEFDWDHVKNRGGEIRTPFVVTVPAGFKPPFRLSATPERVIYLAEPSRGGKGSHRIEGYAVFGKLRPTQGELEIELEDGTGALAGVTMDIPDEAECMNPPRKVRALIKKFRDAKALRAEGRRILEAADMAGELNSADGRDTMDLFAWIGGLKECHCISDRARRLFKDQAALYRLVRGGKAASAEEVARLLRALDGLGASDMKAEFLEGFFGR